MTNEEILMAAQNSREEVGEYERTITKKSVSYGAAIGVTVCTVMILIELFVFKKLDFGKPSIIFIIGGYSDFYEGIKNNITKKKVKGIIKMILAVICILLYIGAFFV